MAKFLIQTYNGEIVHDFSWTLIQAIKFKNWLSNDNDLSYTLTDGEYLEGYIPIGSVEFVHGYFKTIHNKSLKPINIPTELLKPEYLARNVFIGTKDDVDREYFVKSNEQIKSFTEVTSDKSIIPDGEMMISELIDIESEWRCFVYKNKLVGVQNYSGDFTKFPDVKVINEMIVDYKSQPISYTLDVAVSKGKTVVIEVHDFYSCGLYGFADYNILPLMFTRWYYEFLTK